MILAGKCRFIFSGTNQIPSLSLKSFKALTKKESGNSIKMLRLDGEGEYDSHEFSDFCKQHGI